jgi:hypothetical protein
MPPNTRLCCGWRVDEIFIDFILRLTKNRNEREKKKTQLFHVD